VKTRPPAPAVMFDDGSRRVSGCAARLMCAVALTAAAMWRHRRELPALWRELRPAP
jgi:hypothetical protein